MVNFKVVAQNYDLIDDYQTGKILCKHLYQANASGTLIGHPDIEDSLETVRKKIQQLITLQSAFPDALPFNVIMLGESLEEFSNNSLYDIAMLIKNRCSEIFKEIPDDFIKQTLLIYEPKWAASDENLPPSPKLISQVTNKMRDFLTERLGGEGFKVSLMYGEVSSPERAVEILKNDNLQGLMLGADNVSVERVLEFIKAIQFAYDDRKIILVLNFKSFERSDSYQDYFDALAIVPDNYTIYFAPPATDIYHLNQLIK